MQRHGALQTSAYKLDTAQRSLWLGFPCESFGPALPLLQETDSCCPCAGDAAHGASRLQAAEAVQALQRAHPGVQVNQNPDSGKLATTAMPLPGDSAALASPPRPAALPTSASSTTQQCNAVSQPVSAACSTCGAPHPSLDTGFPMHAEQPATQPVQAVAGDGSDTGSSSSRPRQCPQRETRGYVRLKGCETGMMAKKQKQHQGKN